MITLGIPDDKLQQAAARHLLRTLPVPAGGVKMQLFKDDDDLREILGTTGVPFYEPVFSALQSGTVDAVPVQGTYIPLFMPAGLQLADLSFETDPWVLVTQGSDGLASDPEGTYTVGGMSRAALGWWKHTHPGHKTVRVQTDVHTRLRECSVGGWDAGLFRKSELDLLQFEQHYDLVLEEAPLEPFQGFYGWLTGPRGLEPGLLTGADANTRALFEAQRALLHHLGARATAPIGLRWTVNNGRLDLTVSVYRADGSALTASASGESGQAPATARQCAADLLARGAGEWVSGPHAED